MPIDQSLVGREFPPTAPREVTEDHVRAFVEATGGEYAGQVPPTYPIVLTFDAMFGFLDAEQIDLFRIVHGDQKFGYQRPIEIGDVLTATLSVAGVRSMGGADILRTTSEVRDAGGDLVCTASATLVHSGGDA
jgi:acyl dehydratase